jgi:hypothetical protein
MHKYFLRALLLIGLLTSSVALFAQQTGMISGTVTDVSGAVVPHANVTLINAATKDVRHVTTNDEGVFVFPAAVTGDYSVQIQATGFRNWEMKFSLHPGDRFAVKGIQLAVKTENESLTVEASTSQVQIVDSGERSSTLYAKDIRNLALEGRDVTELVKTLPGFSNLTGGGSGGALNNASGLNSTVTSINSAVGNGMNANGTPTRVGATDLTSDGAHVVDPGCNCAATQTVNADMVQEVKVTTSNYSADSTNGPVTIQAVGKSGSSQFHGNAYLHFRDSSMNSTDSVVKTSKLDKPNDRYWYPGGQISGPVRIPGTDFNKNNKLFFFTGYEYYNQSFPDSVVPVVHAVVPTDSMRAGNFDPTAKDNARLCSLTGDPYWAWMPQCGAINSVYLNGQNHDITNSDISSYMDPGGMAIMKMIPQANVDPVTTAGHYNYVTNAMNTENGYMWHSRVDYNFNESTKLYVSYNQQHDQAGIPVMLWWAPPTEVPFPGGFVAPGSSRTLSGNLVKVFSPTFTNEFIATLAYLNNAYEYANEAGVSRKALGYPYQGIFNNTDVMPSLSNGWWIPGYPMIYQQDAHDYVSKKVIPSFADNITKVIGTHTLKFGMNWQQAENDQMNFTQQNGQLQFGTWGATGNPVANLLLGASTAYTESTKNLMGKMAYQSLGFYAQDDWKATRRLTLNLGIRVTHDPGWTDSSGNYGFATWTPERYAKDHAAGVTFEPGMRWNAMDRTVPMAGRDVQPLFVAPRLGLAFDMFGDGKTVLRGGFGGYYYHDQFNDYQGALTTAQGGRSCNTNGVTQLADITASSSGVNCGQVGGAIAVNPNDHTEPMTYVYSFTVSQVMPGKSLLELAYSGNQSSNLINPVQNQNVIPLGAFFGPDPTTGVVNSIVDIENNSGWKNHYKPMPEYVNLALVQHGAFANYNALQVSWSKSQGALTYNLNYTWSKTMGIIGQMPGGYDTQPDPINMHNDYGVSYTNRPHVFNASYSYELGHPIKSNWFLGGVVNGWMISGITGIQSGAPLGQAGNLNFGISGAGDNKNCNGDPACHNAYYLDNISILGSSDYKLMPLVNCDPAAQGSHTYVNSNCFGVPAVGQDGQFLPPTVYGPAYWNSDIALQKTFRLTERQNVQFRISAFNFLNHKLDSFNSNDMRNLTLKYVPATDGLPTYAGYNGPYKQYSDPGVLFGSTIVSGQPWIVGRRVVEFGMKYSF